MRIHEYGLKFSYTVKKQIEQETIYGSTYSYFTLETIHDDFVDSLQELGRQLSKIIADNKDENLMYKLVFWENGVVVSDADFIAVSSLEAKNEIDFVKSLKAVVRNMIYVNNSSVDDLEKFVGTWLEDD